ncbi:M23 family metallopeptidase [Mucilaginibacter sp. PAMB04274]|uniref:M23 family metallopeptidase n=1 Tax=Mucilaginibacter sp. PAMB04274 TaxID=3138568 RepID=UPI0031F6D09D
MPKAFLLNLLLLLSVSRYTYGQQGKLFKYCNAFDKLNSQVTNGSINRNKAAHSFSSLITKIKAVYNPSTDDKWVFPLAGYSARDIGGTHGDGYNDKGYNYFDGNKHTAHPAHDIFIDDRNHDDLDDHTQLPVNVLAVADGLVLACSNTWDAESDLRGGRYIWLYHPQQNIITYYAHNRNVFVKPGDIIKRGQKIAEVGRTGFNAYKQRSPTHLHFSAFNLTGNLPVPYNPYQALTQAARL